MEKKSILICGAGSIGVYLGAMLYSRRHNVKMFGRRKLMKVGNKIIIKDKEFEVPEKIFKLPKNSEQDFVFITTKLYDFDNMVNLIRKNKIKEQIVSAIQNGLVDTSKDSKILKKKIAPVTVFSGFNLKGNELHLNPTKIGWKTEYSKEGKKISELFSDAGILCQPAKNFDSLRAEKTIVNCCLNALSAIENKHFCDLFRNKKTRERILKVFDETYNILKREYKLDDAKVIRKRMFKNWEKLKHYSSTCQDIHSGRKNEVQFFNGYIVNLGKKYNLPFENNLEILRDIRKIEKR